VTKLEEIRERLAFVDGTAIPIVDNEQDSFRIWTFGGGLANGALADALPGPASRADDFCISVKARNAASAMESFSKIDGSSIRPSISAAMISGLKFNSCLSEEIATSTIAWRLLDRDGIKATLSRKTKLVHTVEVN
jgi:hypothetical protein